MYIKYHILYNENILPMGPKGITNMEDGKLGSEESPVTKTSTWELLVNLINSLRNFFL